MLCLFSSTIGYPLSAPVLSCLFIVQGKGREAFTVHQLSQNVNTFDTAKRQSSFREVQILRQGPLNPILGANPFLTIKYLFCRFPLPTLFCGPEATDLGDLMQFGVRSRVPINLSFGFSKADGSASDTSNGKVNYQPIKPIARQSDFREKGCQKEKNSASRSSHLHCRIPLRHCTLSTS